MNRKNNSTWTDELRSAFENAEMSPSEGSWERLQADLGKRRAAAWLPYAGLATALAAAVLGVFLFTRKGPQQGVTVIESPQGGVVAQAPEAAPKASAEPQLEIPSTQEATEPKAAAKPKAEALVPKAEAPVSVAPAIPEKETTHREETSIKDEAPHREEITVEESTANNADPFREDYTNGHPVTLERKKERRKMSVSLSGGGLGGNQSKPFILYPSEWEDPGDLIGSESIYRFLKKEIENLDS